MVIILFWNHNLSEVDYTYTTINVNWLAAGVLLISSGVGLLNDQIQYTYAGIECVSASASGFQGPAAMTNKKQAILTKYTLKTGSSGAGFA